MATQAIVRIRVWLWNTTFKVAWAILSRLGAEHMEVRKVGETDDG